jgi:hypothetical protein
MEKVRCFLVVSLISIIAIILTDFTYQFKDALIDTGSASDTGLLLLQFLIVIKYLAVLLVLKPVNVNISQLSFGFLTSDLIIVVLSFSSKNVFMVPLHIMVIQILVVLITMWFERSFRLGSLLHRITFLKLNHLSK